MLAGSLDGSAVSGWTATRQSTGPQPLRFGERTFGSLIPKVHPRCGVSRDVGTYGPTRVGQPPRRLHRADPVTSGFVGSRTRRSRLAKVAAGVSGDSAGAAPILSCASAQAAPRRLRHQHLYVRGGPGASITDSAPAPEESAGQGRCESTGPSAAPRRIPTRIPESRFAWFRAGIEAPDTGGSLGAAGLSWKDPVSSSTSGSKSATGSSFPQRPFGPTGHRSRRRSGRGLAGSS